MLVILSPLGRRIQSYLVSLYQDFTGSLALLRMTVMLVCPNLEDVLVQVHASVAEMRPPAAIFFGFGKVELDIACTQEFRIALLQDVSVRCSDKACAPEREMTFDTRAVCCNHECAVCNRMSAHDRHPAVLLARVNFLRLRIHPANSGRVDEHTQNPSSQ